MRIKEWFFLTVFLSLVQGGCGTVENVGEKITEWLGAGDTRELVTRRLSMFEYEDKMRGAWAGAMIGAGFGAPYAGGAFGERLEASLRPWRPERAAEALESEVLLVQLTWLKAVEEKGLSISAAEAGSYLAATAFDLTGGLNEARLNLWSGLRPPDSGHPRYNPYANGGGFLASAAPFGILCPGMPQTAVKLAQRAGRASHYGDGMMGGLFSACLYSAAFFERDPAVLIEAAVNCLPGDGGLARAVRDVMAFRQDEPDDWRACWDMIQQRHGGASAETGAPASGSAAINGAYAALALLYGGDSFGDVLEIAVRCGGDAEGNAALAGGAWACANGFNRIPREYQIGIPLISGRNFEESGYTFDALLPACRGLTRQIVERGGGSTERLGQRQYFAVPIESYRSIVSMERFSPGMADDYRTFWEQLQSFRLGHLQRTLNEGLRSWAPGWELANCAPMYNPGFLEEYQGQPNVLVTHPLEREVPCELVWRGTLPAGAPALRILATCSDLTPNAAWVLRVKVNQRPLEERLIERVNGMVYWHDISVGLAEFAGQNVTINVENASDNWNNEAACWARLQIVSL